MSKRALRFSCAVLLLIMLLGAVACEAGVVVTNDNLDDHVVYSLGVSRFLGRLWGGSQPTECHPAVDAIFDVVFRPDPETKEIFSWILNKWEWEDDKTFVMYMKDDIYFWNGENATAEDLLFSYTSYEASEVNRNSDVFRNYGILWDQCKVRDKYTVELKFEQFYAPFLNYPVYLLNKKWVESVGFDNADAWRDPVSSGPYRCVEYVNDDHIKMTLREDYWNKDVGPFYVDEFNVIYYPDEATMFMDLEVGKLDLCGAPSADLSRYIRDGDGGQGFTCFQKPIGTTVCFYFGYINRPEAPLWYNKRLREAVAVGVDWTTLGQITYRDRFQKARGVTPPASPEFIDAGWGTLEFDQEKARQIMVEEGYGPDNHLKLHSIMMNTSNDWRMLNETVQFMLSEIYIDYTFELVDTPTAMDAWRLYNTVDIGFHWYHRGSAAFELRQAIPYIKVNHNAGQKFTMIDDDEAQALYDQLTTTADPVKRKEAGAKLQQRFHDELLIIPIADIMAGIGYRTDRFVSTKQIDKIVISDTVYQLSRLGLLSSWQ